MLNTSSITIVVFDSEPDASASSAYKWKYKYKYLMPLPAPPLPALARAPRWGRIDFDSTWTCWSWCCWCCWWLCWCWCWSWRWWILGCGLNHWWGQTVKLDSTLMIFRLVGWGWYFWMKMFFVNLLVTSGMISERTRRRTRLRPRALVSFIIPYIRSSVFTETRGN